MNLSTGDWRKSGPMRKALFIATILVCTAIGFGSAPAMFWTDPATGLAIGGYDPVAYYTSAKERPGIAEYEVAWRGQIWRFANEGNKAAFIAAPNVYAPQFDGYGLVSVSRGLPAVGNPRVWAIHQDQLYFFHNTTLRALWRHDSDQILNEARLQWPKLKRTID